MNYILKKKYNFIMLATVITGLVFSSTANAFDKTKCYEIKTWGENDRKGEIGQVFQYKNPKTKDIEFFELVKLGKDKKYWYFPTDKSNNKYWSYLGTDNPNEISIHRWGENDRKGEIGQIFQYKNPKTKDIEFFELVKLGKDKKYWYFPTDKSNNKYWNYLGTEKPTKDCTTVVDSIAPVITIVGANPTNITVNSDYNDLGATAIDDIDGDISANIEVTGKVDTSKIGKYKVTYSVSDKAGNKTTATRVINVIKQPHTNPTPEEIIKELEDTGQIPVLDRSSDLAGPDTNNNGVRDDIDNYINKNYPDERENKALLQVARAAQNRLLVDKDSDIKILKKVATKGDRAIDCSISVFGFRDDPSSEIHSLVTNTKKRYLENIKFSKALDGTTASLLEGDGCDE